MCWQIRIPINKRSMPDEEAWLDTPIAPPPLPGTVAGDECTGRVTIVVGVAGVKARQKGKADVYSGEKNHRKVRMFSLFRICVTVIAALSKKY